MAKRGYAKQNKRNGRWGFDLWLHDPVTGRKTRRVRIYDWSTRAEAEAVALRIVQAEQAAQYGGTPPAPTPGLRQVCERRLASLPIGHERTRATRVLESWLELLPAGLRLTEVTTPHIRLYVERRQADGQSPASVDRELNIISATLNAARDYWPELHQWVTPKIPRPRLPKTRRERLITDEEYRKILEHLTRPRRDEERQLEYQARIRTAGILRFALLTGMRPKEIFLLRWEDLDWDGQRIRVRGTKTEKRVNSTRYVPLTQPLVEILRKRQAVEESPEYVFSLSGSPRYTDYDLLREACEANGIPYGRSTRNGFELYCARHTFTTRLLLAGLSLSEVGAITGHSSRELVLYYSHVVPESAARAAAAIERIEQGRLGEIE